MRRRRRASSTVRRSGAWSRRSRPRKAWRPVPPLPNAGRLPAGPDGQPGPPLARPAPDRRTRAGRRLQAAVRAGPAGSVFTNAFPVGIGLALLGLGGLAETGGWPVAFVATAAVSLGARLLVALRYPRHPTEGTSSRRGIPGGRISGPEAGLLVGLATWLLAGSVQAGGLIAQRWGHRNALRLRGIALSGACLLVLPGTAPTPMLVRIGVAGGLPVGVMVSLPPAGCRTGQAARPPSRGP